MSAAADRNLLFGILAVQLDFVHRDALLGAMAAWLLNKARPLGDILLDQGHLSQDRLRLLTALVAEHLVQHGDDPEKSLAALSSVEPTLKQQLAALPDTAVQQSVAHVRANGARQVHRASTPTDPDATAAQCVPRTATAGRYRILRPHASGGLGEVFVAEDTELGRQVALKEIRAEHAGRAESRQRFVLEAEITGGLEHPGIVPVYGLGTYADGRPFYAMRFIKGDNLREAIRQFHGSDSADGRRFDSLAFRELLSRFVDVCQAVAYAHSRGVLHRDLKPGNVMLGKYGETLVVDWGLAKPVGRSEAVTVVDEATLRARPECGSSNTVTGEALGTPPYMAPEQAAGRLDELGPAADVYSLGATLYELLTGKLAFPKTDLAAVQRGDFPPPGRVTPDVPRPLEAVCLKAMALRPDDRYASAQRLAADVERWLADEPVAAYREPVGARARRWVRKHARLATGVAAALAVALAATAVVAWQREDARRAVALEQSATARERDEKEVERQKAAEERDRALAARQRTREALDAMVSGVTGESLATRQAISEEQKAFLRSVLKYYEEFASEPGEDKEAQERLASAHLRLGLIRARLGHHDEGATALARAAKRFAALAEAFPRVAEYRLDLAASHRHLGILLTELDKRAEAEDAYRAALSLLKKLADDFPAMPVYRWDLAVTHHSLANVLAHRGKRLEAEDALRTALTHLNQLSRDFPGEPVYRWDLAASHSSLGNLLADLGKRPEAEEAYRAALALQEKLVTDSPDVPGYRRDLATTHYYLGNLLAGLGRRPGAEDAYRAALPLQAKLVTDFPGMADYRRELARTYFYLGVVQRRLGKRPAAEDAYRAALALQKQLAADFPAVAIYRRELAHTHNNLGNLLADLGKLPAAEDAYRAALALQAKLVTDFPDAADYRRDLARSHHNLGILHRRLGKRPAAEDAYRVALALQEKLVTDFPDAADYRQELARIHNDLGIVLAELGKWANAEVAYRTALGIQEKLAADLPDVPEHRQAVARSRVGLADLLARGGDHVRAVAEAEAVARVPDSSARTLYDAARVLSLASAPVNDDAGGAERRAARAVELLRQAFGKGFTDVSNMLENADFAALRSRSDYVDLLWDLADGPASGR